MNTLDFYITEYIDYCRYRKRLDFKTLKAYQIDLMQYKCFCPASPDCFSKNTLDTFITDLFVNTLCPKRSLRFRIPASLSHKGHCRD